MMTGDCQLLLIDNALHTIAQIAIYYTEIGNVGFPSPGYGLPNTGDFQNLLDGYYWSATEYSSIPNDAWLFSLFTSFQ